MEIGLLIKNYDDNRVNLECALSYVIDELYDINHSDIVFSLDDVKKRLGVLASIVQDIDHTNKTIEVLRKLDDKEQENNG